jgi:hypothetical protein
MTPRQAAGLVDQPRSSSSCGSHVDADGQPLKATTGVVIGAGEGAGDAQRAERSRSS